MPSLHSYAYTKKTMCIQLSRISTTKHERKALLESINIHSMQMSYSRVF